MGGNEIKNYSTVLSERHIDVIKELFNNFGEIEDISTATVCKPGDNYASEIIAVKVKINNHQIFNIIAKLNLNKNKLEEIEILNNALFNNEIIMYKRIIPKFNEILKSSILRKNIFKSAYLFGAIDEKRSEIIFLEDMRSRGFFMLDKLKPLSDNIVKLILTYLAQFHSFSFALKETEPEEYLEICNSLVDTNSFNDANFQENSFWLMGCYFSELFNNLKYKNVIIDTFSKYVARVRTLTTSEKDSKYLVIIHGDCWVNNILFKFEKKFSDQCVLIDYQLSRESAPVADILHLIFNSTDYETRFDHYINWLDYYYSELQKSLLELNLEKNCYPKSKFYRDVKKYSKAYLSIAIIRSFFLLRDSNESVSVNDAFNDSKDIEDLINSLKDNALTGDTLKRIKYRIEGLIDSCTEFGYLKGKKRRKPVKKRKKLRLQYKKDKPG